MEWNPAFRDMDRPKGYHTERSEKDENKYIICLYMLSRKMVQMNLYAKQK